MPFQNLFIEQLCSLSFSIMKDDFIAPDPSDDILDTPLPNIGNDADFNAFSKCALLTDGDSKNNKKFDDEALLASTTIINKGVAGRKEKDVVASTILSADENEENKKVAEVFGQIGL